MQTDLRQSSPIVVVGMHRSGTRLLAQVLGRLGVFMGADQQADAESVTFMTQNESILHQCGAFWSEPMSAYFVLSDPAVVQRLAASTGASLEAGLAAYVGASGWRPQASPFGWKDPRNTFTLPVWREVFPNLRVIHILRHGADAAASLSRRHSQALRAASGGTMPSALTVMQDHALGVLSSRRGWTLAEALTMWEQYVEKARLEAAELGERALEVRFEDLLLEPQRVIPEIAEFCNVPAPREPGTTLGRAQTSRAFAFRSDPGLAAFASSVRETLERYGYAP